MLVKVVVAGAAVLIPLTGNASVVKQRPFDFRSGIAASKVEDVFVVCTGCPDDRLSVLPAAPKLTVRLSMNEPQAGQSIVKEPEKKPEVVITEKVPCLVGTVLFPFDKAEITERERKKLDEVIGRIPAGAAVSVNGYSCELGSSFYNFGLSLRRARAVAAHLEGKGIAVEKVEGLGFCCPASADNRLNRRVEISTQKEER